MWPCSFMKRGPAGSRPVIRGNKSPHSLRVFPAKPATSAYGESINIRASKELKLPHPQAKSDQMKVRQWNAGFNEELNEACDVSGHFRHRLDGVWVPENCLEFNFELEMGFVEFYYHGSAVIELQSTENDCLEFKSDIKSWNLPKITV